MNIEIYIDDAITALNNISDNEYSEDAGLVINAVIEDLKEVLDQIRGAE